MLARAGMVVAFSLAIAGCSSSKTCLLSDNDGEALACIDYSSAISSDDAEASCTGGGGEYREGDCEAGAVAMCDAFGSTTWYYPEYLNAFSLTLADLRQSCQDTGGTFTDLGG